MENAGVAARIERPLAMSEAANSCVIYEQPLSERIRAFLRLEYLFQRANHELQGDDLWSSRTTLDALMDVMALMGRSDVKKEIIKELERHANTLEALSRNPKVDRETLEEVLSQVKHFLGGLKVRENPPGYELKHHEFLSSVRQRSSIPAGTCDFDLPNLHFWLQHPLELRRRDLKRWLAAYDVMRDGITLCLQLVRESSPTTREVAEGGFYQRNLAAATPCQMIRVALESDMPVFPEISAGRHRFTVRFMRLDNTDERPVQTEGDIEFRLNCCVL